MSSKGYLKIPESQLDAERRKTLEAKTWHNNIMNFLLGKNVCASCLRKEDDLVHWDAEFVFLRYDCDEVSTLKNIITSTFGPSVTNIIPTNNFCQICVNTILSAHLLILQLKSNCKHIQRKLTEISQQMKWTCYLDDNGSLTETKLNNIDDSIFKTDSGIDEMDNIKDALNAIETNVKTHKIILDTETLKEKLLQEPDMHKFLFIEQREVAEPKLPAETTIRKVVSSVDVSDFAPHDLLELNWEEDNESMALDTEQSNKLQSNEALIMNLMEEAKTVEKHKHFYNNLNLQANTDNHPVATQVLNDSLSVKLVQDKTTSQTETSTEQELENYTDVEDLVPLNLLELKWQEEPNSTTQQTNIPVKKLNFNQALTVKYIPAHKLRRVENSVSALAPHELLELNWNEDTEAQNANINEPVQKHSIDLTKWLQDQGMSTIKAKTSVTENSNLQNLTNNENGPKMIKLHNKDIKRQISETGQPKALNCNIAVKNLDILREPDNNVDAIRCALCDLSFIQFASYLSHYKTHGITDKAKCYRCSGKFPVIELLVEHLLLVHSEDMAYCTICYAMLNQNRLAKHMVDHHAKKVEIINAASTIPLIRKDGRCVKCNRSTKDQPHVCVFHLGCLECTENCIHERFLASYLDQIKANKAVFKCTDCEYLYKTKQDIIRHANHMHLNHKTHQCVICKSQFASLTELTKHSYLSHFTCRRCKKVHSDKDSLYTHVCPKEITDLSCEDCGQTFISETCYIQHMETAAAVSTECVLCHNIVLDKCNMSRHMQVKHQLSLRKQDKTTLYECSICQKLFDNEIDFRQHTCLFECRICSRRFINKTLHERHLQAHLGVKQQCSVCNIQLLDKTALTAHMGTHTNHGKCPICLIYVQNEALQHHIESHEGPKDSLKCPYCPLLCENRNQYEVHVNRFHLMCRPYQCDLCKKSYYGKQRLREHIRQHNAQARSEKCSWCGKKFARRTTLEKHIKLHYTGKLYNCEVCNKQYISAALLNQHKKCHTQFDSNLPMPETSEDGQI